jgi:hypothetical protein
MNSGRTKLSRTLGSHRTTNRRPSTGKKSLPIRRPSESHQTSRRQTSRRQTSNFPNVRTNPASPNWIGLQTTNGWIDHGCHDPARSRRSQVRRQKLGLMLISECSFSVLLY